MEEINSSGMYALNNVTVLSAVRRHLSPDHIATLLILLNYSILSRHFQIHIKCIWYQNVLQGLHYVRFCHLISYAATCSYSWKLWSISVKLATGISPKYYPCFPYLIYFALVLCLYFIKQLKFSYKKSGDKNQCIETELSINNCQEHIYLSKHTVTIISEYMSQVKQGRGMEQFISTWEKNFGQIEDEGGRGKDKTNE
jgi:hypothetical protein